MARLQTTEDRRLEETKARKKYWKRWGPYLSERQWGTVREDYSPGGTAWEYFPHDHARSRAYRWGEDGIGGISDRHQLICFGLALWNGRDPILKERLFGLTGHEGNHGEDVKEYYFYLDSTPAHTYMRMLYKYPQTAFPYTAISGREPQARQSRARIRTGRHGRVRGEPLLRRVRRICESGCGRHPHQDHGGEPRPGIAPRCRFCLRCGFATPGLGARICGGRWCAPGPAYRAACVRNCSIGNTGSAGCSAPDSPDLLFTENETNMQRLYSPPESFVCKGRVSRLRDSGRQSMR